MIIAGLQATGAAAVSPHRLVVVVAQAGDPRAAQQHALLANDAAALRERDVMIQDMTPDAAGRERPDLAVDQRAGFEVLLVGKDGGVKLRRTQPVGVDELSRLIDTMPMRQVEMRRRR